MQHQQQRYEAKPDPEVYFLPDHANNSIPKDVRDQFQCDAYGRVLFFTAPPVEKERRGPKLGHSAKFLAWKAERDELKRKRDASSTKDTQQTKRAKSAELEAAMAKARLDAVERLNEELVDATVDEYRREFGEKWREAMEMDLDSLEKGQEKVEKLNRVHKLREERRMWEERKELEVKGMGGMLEFGVRT